MRYTLVIRNTGSGDDDFIVTTEYDNDWDISIDFTDFNLDAGESKTIKVTLPLKIRFQTVKSYQRQ